MLAAATETQVEVDLMADGTHPVRSQPPSRRYFGPDYCLHVGQVPAEEPSQSRRHRSWKKWQPSQFGVRRCAHAHVHAAARTHVQACARAPFH